jgi:hypothetical protein
MQNNKIPYYPKTTLICTDGSTINTTFLYSKDDFYLNPDIKSNNIWLPEIDAIELEGLSGKSSKFENYEFDFESLVSSDNTTK